MRHQDATPDHVDQALRAVTARPPKATKATNVGTLRLGSNAIVNFEHEQRTGEHQILLMPENSAMAMKARRQAPSAVASSELGGLLPRRAEVLVHEVCAPLLPVRRPAPTAKRRRF